VIRHAAAILAFALVATANSGGYRFGVSDQAYHVPAIAAAVDASLFPRDRALFDAQSSRTLGDDIIAALAWSPDQLPALFVTIYFVALAGLGAAALAFSRALGASVWAGAAALLLIALRHRIPKTGANSLEGYMNPRMLAFALGVAALAAYLRRRPWWITGLLLVAATAVHSTAGAWFALALGLAELVRRRSILLWLAAGLAAGVAAWWLLARMPRMDEAWLAVLAEKDYLFVLQWPAYAWALNLSYPAVLWMLHLRRRTLGVARPLERPLVLGLLGLVVVFFASIPFAEAGVALAVQLQVNRVFWLLDVVVFLHVAWWLMDDLGAVPAWRRGLVAALLAAAACGRGYYVLRVDSNRPLVRVAIEDSDWTRALAWLRGQPTDWQVLAHPGHAWKYGPSVRAAALRDTVLEQGKDSALAIYDRAIAMRVAERMHGLAGFDQLDDARRARELGARYGAQVLILERARTLDLPVLFENAGFRIYDLR
jgi:hypothetical protein